MAWDTKKAAKWPIEGSELSQKTRKLEALYRHHPDTGYVDARRET